MMGSAHPRFIKYLFTSAAFFTLLSRFLFPAVGIATCIIFATKTALRGRGAAMTNYDDFLGGVGILLPELRRGMRVARNKQKLVTPSS